MLKKILIAIGVLAATAVIIIAVAGIIIMHIVDKPFIESRISQALNRQVKIEEIDVSIFSFVSGIEVKKMVISNFKTLPELVTLKDKPVAAGDVFVAMDALHFKVKFLPILRKQFELDELVSYRPVIYLARSKQGILNCSDLIKSKKRQPAEKADVKKDEDGKDATKPLTADDIPIAITVGEIGIKNGTINYYDGEFDQKFQVYNLTILAYDISVDPKDLAKKDEIKSKIALGLKTVGPMRTGSVQRFDITIDASGKIIPFDTKTRELEPEIIMHTAFPDGQIDGLQIFSAVAAIPLLGDYLGEHISFLKGKQEWKNSKASYVDLHYKAGRAEISNGSLDLKEAKLLFAGMVNTDSNALDMKFDMLMTKEISSAVKSTLAKRIDAGIKNSEVKKYADADKLAEEALQPLLNKDGLIDMKFKVSGTTKKTDVKLVQPQLDALDGFIKKSAGNVLLEAGKSAGKKLIGKDQNKVLDNALDFLKK